MRYISLNTDILAYFDVVIPWCSGYHVSLTHSRSPVRSRAESLFFFFFFLTRPNDIIYCPSKNAEEHTRVAAHASFGGHSLRSSFVKHSEGSGEASGIEIVPLFTTTLDKVSITQ